MLIWAQTSGSDVMSEVGPTRAMGPSVDIKSGVRLRVNHGFEWWGVACLDKRTIFFTDFLVPMVSLAGKDRHVMSDFGETSPPWPSELTEPVIL